MPKLIVKVPNGQLEDVVTKLINNAISFSILFDEAEQAGMQVVKQEVVNLSRTPHPNNKVAHPITEQAMGKAVLQFLDNAGDVSSEEVANFIESSGYGWKRSSSSSTLSSLYKAGKITRVRQGKAYIYNIIKQPNLI
jgi:hypothetical protein